MEHKVRPVTLEHPSQNVVPSTHFPGHAIQDQLNEGVWVCEGNIALPMQERTARSEGGRGPRSHVLLCSDEMTSQGG